MARLLFPLLALLSALSYWGLARRVGVNGRTWLGLSLLFLVIGLRLLKPALLALLVSQALLALVLWARLEWKHRK